MSVGDYVFFFKQKTAYEMRISDWSSDVCSSDLARRHRADLGAHLGGEGGVRGLLDLLDAGNALAQHLDVVQRLPHGLPRCLDTVLPGHLHGLGVSPEGRRGRGCQDRKSTRLNSSH